MALWDRDQIVQHLSPWVRAHVPSLEIFPQLDSTNSYLLEKAAAHWPSGAICLAEQQRAGRGRQGRTWVSPLGSGLALSLLWRLPAEKAVGLSLMAGVATAQTVQSFGISGVGLKWPNDVQWQGRKLGGILLESGGRGDDFYVVMGIGLNVALPAEAGQMIDQPWVDFSQILGVGKIPPHNLLAAQLIDTLITALLSAEQTGLSETIHAWNTFDVVRNQRVTLQLPARAISGIARGIDTQGALLLETEAGIAPYMGGEIRLRLEESFP